MFAIPTHQPLLDTRCNQGAVSVKKTTTSQTSGSSGTFDSLLIQKPLIGDWFAMKPHRMIKARAFKAFILPAEAVRK